ncbi:DUF3153 domain-containing protein [Natroniella sulfidigena]|uniref:DUF3153 domain-containing protein n=1 Tax=Natroniella sulfidigena TaxID=723921 RepID=UPI002009F15D|nr:DUF3153 domain-containing protein [Natroniella sulfidigena]MCK8816909.1 DUF3153 domain-containing protein [Natroniella sulfidigena]
MGKRKFILLVLGLLAIILLTGCMKLRSNVTMNKDGSGQIEYIFGMESSFYAFGGQEVSNFFIELEDMALEKGYGVDTFDDGKYMGLVVSREVADFASYERNLGLLGQIEEKSEAGLTEIDDVLSLVGVEEEKSFLMTTYKYDKVINLEELAWEEDEQVNNFFSTALLEDMDLGLELNLPVEATESNATTIQDEGKKLIWELELGEKNQIYFELKVLKFRRVVVILLVLISIGLLATVFRKNVISLIN